MSDELTVNASLAYEDSEGTELPFLGVMGLPVDVATKKFTHFKVSVGTSEEAIPLGEATSPGYVVLINRDPTKFVNVKVATGGAIFGKLLAGEAMVLRLGSGAQAPYWIADTAACQCEGYIFQT